MNTKYINYKSILKINLIEESYFDKDIYFNRDELKQSIGFLDKEIDRLEKELKPKIDSLNSKKFIKEFKKTMHYDSTLIILREKKDYKEFEKYTGISYSSFSAEGPMQVHFNVELNGEKGKFIVVSTPPLNFIKRNITQRFLALSKFPSSLWIDLEKRIFLVHELIEAEEFYMIQKKKRKDNGSIFKEVDERLYSIGAHNSLIVLAKEAVILNKYKHLKFFQKVKEMRQMEYQVIKKATGIDLNTLTDLDDKTIKKLSKYNIKIKKCKDCDETYGVYGFNQSKQSKINTNIVINQED